MGTSAISSPAMPATLRRPCSAKHLIFAMGATASQTVSMPGGSLLGFYFVKGDTADNVLANNPTNSATAGKPVAFFSFAAANPDGGTQHFTTANPEGVGGAVPTAGSPLELHAMGKLHGGVNDFDDLAFTVQFTAVCRDSHRRSSPLRRLVVGEAASFVSADEAGSFVYDKTPMSVLPLCRKRSCAEHQYHS